MFDFVGKRVEVQGYFAIGYLSSQPAQLDDLALNQRQPLDVSNHEGSLSALPPFLKYRRQP
jgi:hypothetical protein